MPLLHAQFERNDGRWRFRKRPHPSPTDIPADQHRLLVEAATEYIGRGTADTQARAAAGSTGDRDSVQRRRARTAVQCRRRSTEFKRRRRSARHASGVHRPRRHRAPRCSSTRCSFATRRGQPLHVSVLTSRGRRRTCRHRRSRLDPQVHEQGLPERAPVAAPRARTEDADRSIATTSTRSCRCWACRAS